LKEGGNYFPKLFRIRTHLRLKSLFSNELEKELSDSDLSESTKKEDTPEDTYEDTKRIGVDISMGKEGELFGIGIKNMVTLKKGLVPFWPR